MHWSGVINLHRFVHFFHYGLSASPIPFKELKLKLCDETGAPVGGAEIRGFVKSVSFLKWKESNENICGHTNEAGEFVRYAGAGIGIEQVTKEGFYSEPVNPLYYPAENIPADWIIIKMTKEDPRVRMVGGLFRTKWKGRGHIAFGIRFVNAGNTSDEVKTKRCLVKGRDRADLWIEIRKTVSSGAGEGSWRIRITGQQGWELAPGAPPRDFLSSEKYAMRAAPTAGYLPAVEYPAAMCPSGFYPRKAGGRKYGKLHDFVNMVDERPVSEEISRKELFIDGVYEIQAEETGSRSLNPIVQSQEEKERLLENEGVSLREQDEGLRNAASWGRVDVMQRMMDRGANVDTRDEKGFSAMMIAAQYGYAEAIQFLLDKGADPEILKHSSYNLSSRNSVTRNRS